MAETTESRVPTTGEADGAASFSEPDAPAGCDEALTLMGLFLEAHANLVRVLGTEMEEACGLPLTWYDALVRLRRTPGGFTTMTRLGNEVSLTSGGITRLVDRLVDAGYVERSSCPTDRRSVYVSLTPAGRAKVDEATVVHHRGLERHLLGLLTDDERACLEAAFRKLRR